MNAEVNNFEFAATVPLSSLNETGKKLSQLKIDEAFGRFNNYLKNP